MRTLFLVPTRGRPANAIRLAKVFNETATADARLVFVIDDDDPELDNYRAFFDSDDVPAAGLRFGYHVGPRLRLGPTLNEHAPRYAEHFDAIGFMGDDHLPRTPHWDVELGSEVERSRGIAYGNDLIQGPALPTAVLMHSSIIKSLGFMVPPGLIHMYLDNFWRDLGNMLGVLSYRADVIVQHVHPITGQTDWDAGYTEVNGFMGPDGEVYAKFVADGGLQRCVELIRKA